MGMLDEVKSKKKQKAAENWFKMAEGAKTPEKQVEYYTRSLDVNPYNAEAWFRKGRTLEKMGNFEEAKRSFDLAIEVDPDYQGLIGKKQPAGEPITTPLAESVPEPTTPVEETAFVDSSLNGSEDVQAIETTDDSNDDGWVTETSQEERTSFVPPAGDESVFSNLGSDEDNDVFSSSPSDIANESVSSYGGIEKESTHEELIEDETFEDETIENQTIDEKPVFSDTFSDNNEKEDENTFSAPADNNTVSFSDNEVTEQPEYQEPVYTPTHVAENTSRSAFDDVEAEKLASAASMPERADISSTESSSQPNTNLNASISANAPSVTQCVDIKIPTNEAIKFWAIGIVAMVIAFVIGNLLVN